MSSRIENAPRLWRQALLAARRVVGRYDGGARESIEDVLEEDAEEAAEFSKLERDMLRNLLRFRDVRAQDIMVPRADIEALDEAMSSDEMLERFAAGAHSRMPIYRETLDNPLGLIHIKDIMIAMQGKGKTINTGDLIRKILFVPPSMPAMDMLLQMQAARIHMALVIDEHGGTDGLVSIEDVVEEIVGEIEDEHDDPDVPLIRHEGNGIWEAQARLPVAELEAAFSLSFATEEFADIDTIGGMVSARAGRVPRRGEVVSLPAANGTVLEAIIRDADVRRIRTLEIRTSPADKSDAP